MKRDAFKRQLAAEAPDPRKRGMEDRLAQRAEGGSREVKEGV